VLWLADPGNIGNRREVLRFERDAIAEVSLAPDGSRLALVTKYWKESVLWLAKMDGSDLHQLGPAMGAGGELFWSRNSQSLEDGVILTSLNTGEKRQMFEQQMFDPNTSLRALGYSADGQELYYLVGIPQEIDYKYEIWAVGQDGQGAHRLIAFDQNPGLPILSPDGSKFLIGTSEGVAWVSIDGQNQEVFAQPEIGFTAIWAIDSQRIVIGKRIPDYMGTVVQVVNLSDKTIQDLGLINKIGDWRFLSLSPDNQWLAVYHYYSGLYWIYLASDTIVPVPTPNKGSLRFIAWLPATP
jgi:Tol biopolymer transport system component